MVYRLGIGVEGPMLENLDGCSSRFLGLHVHTACTGLEHEFVILYLRSEHLRTVQASANSASLHHLEQERSQSRILRRALTTSGARRLHSVLSLHA